MHETTVSYTEWGMTLQLRSLTRHLKQPTHELWLHLQHHTAQGIECLQHQKIMFTCTCATTTHIPSKTFSWSTLSSRGGRHSTITSWAHDHKPLQCSLPQNTATWIPTENREFEHV